jgi:hypothetical protein
LNNADLALYGAKGDGRRTYRFFEPGMDARVKARRSLELELRQAFNHGGFEVYFKESARNTGSPTWFSQSWISRPARSVAARHCCDGSIPSAA